MIPEEIQNKLPQIHELCKAHDVAYMYLFGSASRGEMTEKSDLDFLVKIDLVDEDYKRYSNNFFELYDEVEKLFERKVDLLTENMVKNKYFKMSIELDKKVLYEV